MSNLLGILNTGRLGISANQTALAVTGTNISNVNTPGYSRQRPDMQALVTGGVRVEHVERLRDEYLNNRLQAATTSLGGSSVLATNLKSLESLMEENEDTGISKTIRDFFATMQDLTLKPAGQTERDMLRSGGQQLAVELGGLASEIRQARTQLNQQAQMAVDRINSITNEIATLNQRVREFSGGGANPEKADINMMLDRRDALISELATYMPLHAIKDERGVATIFGAGEVLVEGVQQRTLVAVADPANDGLSAIAVRDENGMIHPMTGKLSEGSLGATLKARDEMAGKALDDIERLAASLVRAVNVQHRAGTGLDGVSGRDFFAGLGASATSSWQNKGGATVTAAAIADDTQINFDDYEIRFTTAGQYDIINTTSGAAVSTGNAYASGTAINFAGFSITLSDMAGSPAAGDVIRVNGYDYTSARMGLNPAIVSDVRAIATGFSNSPGDNRNAIALATLLDVPVMGNQTFEEYFNQVRTRISIATHNAETAYGDDEITRQQIQGMVDAVSGVSLDEEATKIIQFQRAFEASSRVVRTTDELMQTLLNMI